MGDRYRAYVSPTGDQPGAYSFSPRESRDRDENPNVEYFGAGESYRPGGHTGSGPFRPQSRTTDTWSSDRRDNRENRRDERREDRREDIDSYIPPTSIRARPRSRSPGNRRRSRSPPARERGDLFANRMRSPPRRPSPRRDDRARSPPRRRSRSPHARGRTPDSKRARDFSPAGRSPKRERIASPERAYDRAKSPARRAYSPPRDARRGGYRSRSRSPPRKTAYNDDNWRRRSPSPRNDSSNHSRRSSPPVHPDRASMAGSVPRSPAYQKYDRRDQSPPRSTSRYNAEDEYQNGEAAPPSGPAASRNGSYDRPPPSGPSRQYSSGGAPTGPGSMSAHNRGGFSAPSGPRSRFDGPSRDFTSPPIRGRGSSLTYRAPTAPRSTSYSDAPPSGPRSGGYGRGDYGGRGDFNSSRGDYGGSYRGGMGRGEPTFPFRGSNNSSSTTYPRTQRFNTVQQQLASTEKIIPGGKLLPSGLEPEQERRLKQLEADSEKLRVDLAEKQKTKREAVNEWEVRERESEREALRSGLAEESLHKLMESEDGGMAAF